MKITDINTEEYYRTATIELECPLECVAMVISNSDTQHSTWSEIKQAALRGRDKNMIHIEDIKIIPKISVFGSVAVINAKVTWHPDKSIEDAEEDCIVMVKRVIDRTKSYFSNKIHRLFDIKLD